MAFGFSPKYIQELPLNNLSPEAFFVIALEAAKKLDWNIGYTSEKGFIAYTSFSMSSSGEEIKVNIKDEAVIMKSECTGSQFMDWGKNKKNIERLTETITALTNTFTPEELVQKYEDLKPELAQAEDILSNQAPTTAKEKLGNALAIFVPTEGYFITPILIDLNIVIFILMAVSGVNILLPDNESLIKWGANFRPLTLEGEWWRLLTNCFLHIGILHLLMNMYALLYIGLLLEPLLGKARFAAAYLLTGIAASVVSLWWHDLTISAGASGAIFGMYGVFLAMLTTNLIEQAARKTLLTSIAVFVGYNLLNGMKGGIDNAAHIGGLISGLAIGYAYIPSLKKPATTNLKYGIIGILAVLVLSVSFMVYQKIPNDIGKYDEKMKVFAAAETKALGIYNLPENTPKEKLLQEIKENGLYYWGENIKLLNDLERLDLPDEMHDRNEKLLQYCDLRIKSYNLIYKAIEQDTDIYQDSIMNYNKQIETIINGLMAR